MLRNSRRRWINSLTLILVLAALMGLSRCGGGVGSTPSISGSIQGSKI